MHRRKLISSGIVASVVSLVSREETGAKKKKKNKQRFDKECWNTGEFRCVTQPDGRDVCYVTVCWQGMYTGFPIPTEQVCPVQ